MSHPASSSTNASADTTRQLLKKREEEIDRRVADLQSRLQHPATSNSVPASPRAIERTHSRGSRGSVDSNKSNLHRLGARNFKVPSAFSDAERSTTDSERRQQTAYPVNRRMVSMKKPSFVPTPNSQPKKKSNWMSWLCPCHPGRRNAAEAAQAANARYERQRLLAEEGRLAYSGYGSGSDAMARHTPNRPSYLQPVSNKRYS